VLEFDAIAGSFDPVVTAYDKTDLVYRLGDKRVYYLRTPLAMPNGELGRTGFWPSFWLRAIADSSGKAQGLTVHHIETPDQIDLPPPAELRALSAATLTFEDSYDSGSSAQGVLRPGLFLHQPTGILHLIEYPPNERSAQYLDADAIREAVRVRGSVDAAAAAQEGSQKAKQTPVHTIFGAFAGLLALVLYWLGLSRAHTSNSSRKSGEPGATTRDGAAKITGPLSLFIAWALVGFGIEQHAHSQGFDPASIIPAFNSQDQRLPEPIIVPFRISWCSANPENKAAIATGFRKARDLLADRGTIHLQQEILFGSCIPGAAEIWWTDSPDDLDPGFLKAHVQSGGAFVVEGYGLKPGHAPVPHEASGLEEPAVGLRWEQPEKRGMLYRSFYLLQTFDGCAQDKTMMLSLRKKQTAKSPVGLVTSASFFARSNDCFRTDEDYRGRSFINLMYALLTTDYKEDQLQLPELLRRVRNLGLEP
jgi:hypothetical protein